jgi:C4-dicarboxylate transporter
MNILTIGVILSVAIFAIYVYFQIKNKGLRELAINLIIEAENIFEEGKNSEKFDYVFEQFYSILPLILKLILTKKNIINFIQMVFEEIKISLDYDKNNKKIDSMDDVEEDLEEKLEE